MPRLSFGCKKNSLAKLVGTLLSDAQPSRVARSIALSPRSEERSSEQRLINIVNQVGTRSRTTSSSPEGSYTVTAPRNAAQCTEW